MIWFAALGLGLGVIVGLCLSKRKKKEDSAVLRCVATYSPVTVIVSLVDGGNSESIMWDVSRLKDKIFGVTYAVQDIEQVFGGIDWTLPIVVPNCTIMELEDNMWLWEPN